MVLHQVQDWLANPDKKDKSVAGYFFFIGMTVFFYGAWYIIFRKIFHKDLR